MIDSDAPHSCAPTGFILVLKLEFWQRRKCFLWSAQTGTKISWPGWTSHAFHPLRVRLCARFTPFNRGYRMQNLGGRCRRFESDSCCSSPPELLPSCNERSAHSCTVKFDVFIVHKAWLILKYIQYLISSTLTGLNIGRVYVCLWAYWSVSTRNVKRATPVLSGGKSQDSVRTKITLNSPPLTLCGAWKRPAGLMNALAHTQRARSTLRCFPGNLEGQNNDFHNVSLQRRRERVRVAEEESKREREWGRALSFPWL